MEITLLKERRDFLSKDKPCSERQYLFVRKTRVASKDSVLYKDLGFYQWPCFLYRYTDIHIYIYKFMYSTDVEADGCADVLHFRRPSTATHWDACKHTMPTYRGSSCHGYCHNGAVGSVHSRDDVMEKLWPCARSLMVRIVRVIISSKSYL